MDENKMNHLLHQTFYGNLKLLGFEKHISINTHYKDLIFSFKMFYQVNQKAFELVTHFLFTNLKKRKDLFKGCFPCSDQKQKADFRKKTNDFIKDFEKEGFISGFVQGVIHSPGGDKFVQLYLSISELCIVNALRDRHNFIDNPLLTTEMKMNETKLLGEKCEEINDKLVKSKKYLKKKVEYLVISNDELKKSKDKIATQFENINKNELNDDKDFNKMKQQINDDLNKLSTKYETINLEIKSIVENLNEASKSLNDTYNSDHLLDFRKDKLSMQNLYCFKEKFKSIQELIDQIETLKCEDLEMINNKTNFIFSEIKKQNEDLTDLSKTLKEELNNLNEHNSNLRAKILSRPDVQERRKWFAERIPRLPKLHFAPIKYDKLNLSDSNGLFNNSSLDNTSIDNVDNTRVMPQYQSFRFSDISVLETCFKSCTKSQSTKDNIINKKINEDDENDLSNVFDEKDISFMSDL